MVDQSKIDASLRRWRIPAATVLAVAVLVAWAYGAWWIRHGVMPYYPVCYAGGNWVYHRILAPLKPEVFDDLAKSYVRNFAPDFWVENGRMYARPYLQLLRTPENVQATVYMVSDLSGEDASSQCREAIRYLTVAGLDTDGYMRPGQLEPLPGHEAQRWIDRLTFHPVAPFQRD